MYEHLLVPVDGTEISERAMSASIGLARKLSGTDPATVVLPTKGARKGGAAVLVLDEPAADAVLAGFR